MGKANRPAVPRSAALNVAQVSLRQLRYLSASADAGGFRRPADSMVIDS